MLVLTPGAQALAAWATSVSIGASPPIAELVALAAFITCAVILWELIALPSALYWSLSVGRRYGRTGAEPTVEGVLGAQARATVVTLVASGVAGVIVRAAIWLTGPWWWIASGLTLAGVLAAALGAAPWLLGWIGDAGPVSRPGLAERLADLAARAPVHVAGIDEWRARRSPMSMSAGSTAIVAGVGRARRVFVSRELIEDWSDEEVAVVVAHELAHHAHHDLWRTLIVDGAILSAAFGVAEVIRGWTGHRLGLDDQENAACCPSSPSSPVPRGWRRPPPAPCPVSTAGARSGRVRAAAHRRKRGVWFGAPKAERASPRGGTSRPGRAMAVPPPPDRRGASGGRRAIRSARAGPHQPGRTAFGMSPRRAPFTHSEWGSTTSVPRSSFRQRSSIARLQ